MGEIVPSDVDVALAQRLASIRSAIMIHYAGQFGKDAYLEPGFRAHVDELVTETYRFYLDEMRAMRFTEEPKDAAEEAIRLTRQLEVLRELRSRFNESPPAPATPSTVLPEGQEAYRLLPPPVKPVSAP